MTAHIDHEASLRAALLAAADTLEPSGDGLERIRARLRQPRPAPLALAQAASAELFMRAPARLQDAVYQVAYWFRLVSERFGPAQPPGRHRSRAHGLLRPLAAMTVVMFIVAAGTYVAIDASTGIFPSSSSSQPGSGPNTGGHTGAPAPGASHTSGTQSALGTGSHTPAPAKSCKPAAPGQPTTSPAAQQSPGTSPSANPTPTDSTSTDTSTPSPGDSAAQASAAPPSAAPSVAPPASSPGPTPVLTKPSGC